MRGAEDSTGARPGGPSPGPRRLVAGEPELARERPLAGRIPVDERTWAQIVEADGSVGLALPAEP